MRAPSKSGKAMGPQEMAALFQILGNKTRMSIVQEIAAGEQCVCTIFKRLRLPQNLISHHLGILREHGVILARREGKWVYYRLNENCLGEAFTAGQKMLSVRKAKEVC